MSIVQDAFLPPRKSFELYQIVTIMKKIRKSFTLNYPHFQPYADAGHMGTCIASYIVKLWPTINITKVSSIHGAVYAYCRFVLNMGAVENTNNIFSVHPPRLKQKELNTNT